MTGSGYVGLVSGACLADVGNDVHCLDVDHGRIPTLPSGGIPIHEPGLKEVVQRNVAAGRLRFTTDIEQAVRFGTIQIVAVGTPPGGDGAADLQYVVAAARNIGRHMTDYTLVGYGGSCFPKDVQALIRTARGDAGLNLKVLAAVEAANDVQKLVLPNKVRQRFGGDLTGRHFALWGLAFKPNTDDMREAPSGYIIKALIEAGATITAYDPVAMSEARRAFGPVPGLSYSDSPMSALADADALLIATEWKEFRSPDFAAIAGTLKHPLIFDGRNMYSPSDVRGKGIEYIAIGR